MTLQEKIEQLFTQSELPSNNFSDSVSYSLHQLVSVRLRSNPNLMQKAKSNLRNWLHENPTVQSWLEWKTILETESFENVLKIMTAENEEGQRLRSSSPFVGIVTARERKAVIEYCEKAKPF